MPVDVFQTRGVQNILKGDWNCKGRCFLMHNKKVEMNGDSLLSVKMSIFDEFKVVKTC